MTNEQKALLEKLKAAQLDLINAAAKAKALPSDKTLSKIADLEIAIGALEHAAED